jgi:VanZ family protein
MKRFLPALIWMVIIFYFSSRPTASFVADQPVLRFYLLKSFHIVEYAILAILLFFGYKKFKFSIPIAYLYAVSDEIHQYFVPGRSCRFTDTLIDLGGILIGSMLLKIVLNWICETTLASFFCSSRKK